MKSLSILLLIVALEVFLLGFLEHLPSGFLGYPGIPLFYHLDQLNLTLNTWLLLVNKHMIFWFWLSKCTWKRDIMLLWCFWTSDGQYVADLHSIQPVVWYCQSSSRWHTRLVAGEPFCFNVLIQNPKTTLY